MTLDASANLTVGAGITNTLTLTGSAYGMLTTTNDLYMQAGGTGSQIIFRRGSTENARIDASGNLLAGTTSTSGSMSNAAAFVGGSFKTATGSFASPPNGSWTTIATISQAGMYLVHAYINNYNAGPGNWSNAFVVSYTGAGPAYLWNLSGAGVGNINGQIVSSNQIQIYCGAGPGPVIYWTIARFGN
jgi:hypothetical protein